MDHLSPLSSAAPPLDSKVDPPFTLSDRPPPYSSTRGVGIPTGPISSATEAPSIPVKAGKGLSLPSGASHGGVLLKHIPYLPPGSVGVGSREAGGLVSTDTWDGSGGTAEGIGGDGLDAVLAEGGGGDVDTDVSTVGEEVSELDQKVRVSVHGK